MKKIIYISIPFILALLSCNLFQSDEKQNAIARVHNKYLFVSDIEGIVPQNTLPEDSILIVNSYIDNWVKDNLILEKAELNLTEEQVNFEKQLEDYRNSLVIYTYEKELIRQNIDTIVSKKEIQDYYETHKQSFELKDNIVKVRYIKVAKNAPLIKKLRKIYNSTKEKEIEALKEYSHQYAEKFYLDDNKWILLDDLVKETPIEISDPASFLKNIKHIELEDSLSRYFVKINEYKLKDNISPLSFEAKNIKNIIINKRKLKLINDVKNDLFTEALNKKYFEIYQSKTLDNE